jgi:uncharacterized surface protein with fasciclin (FAS1) repeats
MKRRQLFRGLAAAVVAGALGATAVSSPATARSTSQSVAAKKQTVVAIAARNSDFSTLASAIKQAGLVKALKGKGPFTVFAPTNEAFAKVPADQLEALLADKDALTSVLTYHVLKGKVPSSALQPTQDVTSLNSAPFTITVADGKATITDGQGNTVNIVKTDIKAKNGVIHVVDAVLLPPASS